MMTNSEKAVYGINEHIKYSPLNSGDFTNYIIDDIREYSSFDECIMSLGIRIEKDNISIRGIAPDRIEKKHVYLEDGKVAWRNSDFYFKHPHGSPEIHIPYKHIEKEEFVCKYDLFFVVPRGNGIESMNHPKSREAVILWRTFYETFGKNAKKNLTHKEAMEVGCFEPRPTSHDTYSRYIIIGWI